MLLRIEIHLSIGALFFVCHTIVMYTAVFNVEWYQRPWQRLVILGQLGCHYHDLEIGHEIEK